LKCHLPLRDHFSTSYAFSMPTLGGLELLCAFLSAFYASPVRIRRSPPKTSEEIPSPSLLVNVLPKVNREAKRKGENIGRKRLGGNLSA